MSARAFWTAFAALALVALLPILVTEIPAFADYPNHLARARVLAHFDESPFFGTFFRPAWAILPNILTDLLMVGAAKALPITVAGRVVLGLIVVTIGAGFAFARREATGGYDALGFGGLLLVYGFPLTMGFLNFSLGVGLLLALFGLHLRLRERGSAIYLAAMIPAGIGLFLCHLMAFVLFGLVVLVWELAAGDRKRWGIAIGRLVAVAAVPAVLFKMSPTNGQVSTWDGSSLLLKLKAIPLSFASGHLSTDVTFAALVVGIVGMLALGRARWGRPALGVLVLLFLVFLIAPFGLGTTKNLDNRIPYVLALFALALIGPGAKEVVVRLPTLIVGAILVHSGLLAVDAGQRGREIDALRVQLRGLPQGSMLFNVIDPAEPIWSVFTWDPPLPSAHTLALLDGEVFPSGLFMIPGQQPLLIRPGLEALYWARSEPHPSPTALAAEIERNLRPLPAEVRTRPRFLMVCGPREPTSDLPVFATGPRYAIYRLSP